MPRKDQGRVIKGGFGKGIINAQKRDRRARRTHQKNADRHTTDEVLESVTDRSTLDDFLSDALLKEQEFVAERQNFHVLNADDQGPEVVFPHAKRNPDLYDYEDIPVPRRPEWKGKTAEQLDEDEKEAFLKWRRMLAQMEENSLDLKMTPFEKTLGIWRQLWRVMGRSDLICQIVDARNPALFRSKDLDRYAKDLSPNKKVLLVINKADYLSGAMRKIWADYYAKDGTPFVFFSAVASQKELDEQGKREREAQQASYLEQRREGGIKIKEEGDDTTPVDVSEKQSIMEIVQRDPTLILSREQMLAYFEEYMEWPASHNRIRVDDPKKKRTRLEVGMVGYPNVGKSSTINVLAGVKRVNVGATPGKTKHFQTLMISDSIMLVDCPGLVFPTFMESSANLFCNGILPIDQMRDFHGPLTEICRRISREQFAKTYSLDFPHWKQLDADQLCEAHARMRGFGKAHNEWDTSRSARILLKDFVVGKLIYCHPPPGLSKEQRLAFANSMSLVSEHLEQVLSRNKQNEIEAGIRGLDLDDIDEKKNDDDDDDDDGGIVPVNVGAVGDKRMNKSVVAATEANAKFVSSTTVDLQVKKPEPNPNKPLTKKQQRRLAKNKKNKSTKSRNATPYGNGAHVVRAVGSGNERGY